MSDPRPIGAATPSPQVHAAIARAAQATGVDFAYLLGEARIESGLNPAARAPTSSAAGLYQFTGSTWLQTVDRHGAAHGLGWAGAAISGGRVADPGQRSAVLNLRFDPDAAALMAGELTNDNRAALSAALGRAPHHGELYMAHFLGADGAAKILSAMAADPARPGAGLVPAAAQANRTIFYTPSGAPRSLGEIKALLSGKLARAMGDLPPGAAQPAEWAGYAPITMPRDSARPAAAALAPPAPRPSMAATLAATFGTGPGSVIPPQVRAAYGKLQAFGL